MLKARTYSAKPTEVKRQWFIVDASTVPLGRMATIVAIHLMGKHKPTYTSHIDCGDGVIVINADNIKLTGNKRATMRYYRHSGHPGALKEISLEQQMAKDSRVVVEKAVTGMLPKNKLVKSWLSRLKIYGGKEHGQEAQKPLPLELSNKKVKNVEAK